MPDELFDAALATIEAEAVDDRDFEIPSYVYTSTPGGGSAWAGPRPSSSGTNTRP